jgi:hypothetical protein
MEDQEGQSGLRTRRIVLDTFRIADFALPGQRFSREYDVRQDVEVVAPIPIRWKHGGDIQWIKRKSFSLDVHLLRVGEGVINFGAGYLLFYRERIGSCLHRRLVAFHKPDRFLVGWMLVAGLL